MSYETAPATLLAATRCICCGKELVDAASVECGVGPVCRKKYLTSEVASDADRKAANALIYQAASESTSNVQKLELAAEVEALGFPNFAEIVRKRFLKKAIRLEQAQVKFGHEEQAAFIVHTPYGPSVQKFNDALKAAIDWKDRAAQWTVDDNDKKRWAGWAFKARTDLKAKVYMLLCKHFDGEEAIGPKGAFTLTNGAA